jgi:acetyl esterase/lipase
MMRRRLSSAPVVTATAANPLTHVSSSSPPFVLLRGSADQLVSSSQTLILHDALLAKGVDSTRYVVEGANHGDMTPLDVTSDRGRPSSGLDSVGPGNEDESIFIRVPAAVASPIAAAARSA